MSHAYYQYNKEQLLKEPRLPLICMPDNATVFQAMAKEMFEEIEANNQAGKKTVFICPVGPVGQYPYFVDMVNERNLSLKDTWFINMDEYLDDDKKWIPVDHPLSFHGFMERTVYTKIKPELIMPVEQRVFPDPENVGYIPELIEKLGGVDIASAASASTAMWHLTRQIRLFHRRNFWHRRRGFSPSHRRRERANGPSAISAERWRICRITV